METALEKRDSILDDDEELVLEIKPTRKAYVFSYICAVICLFTFALAPLGIGWILWIELRLRMDDYKVTNERLVIRNGIVFRNLEELELFRVKDVSVHQGILGRMFNYGSIHVISTDHTTPTIKIVAVENPIKTKEELRKLYRTSRKRERVTAREFI